MNSKTASTYNKTALSGYRIRGLLIGAGVIAALISSFSGSASLRSGSDPLGSKDRQGSLVATVPKFNPMVMPFKPASADLSQVRNGGVGCDATVPNSCDNPADWVNGNAGASNAHYQEGQSIPYRMVMKDLTLGNHSVVIEWDVKHSSANAIDFITHYQRVAESIQPCGPANHPEDIVPGCNPASFTTFDIPAPTGVNSPIAGLPQSVFNALPVAQRRMTMYNGTIRPQRASLSTSLRRARLSSCHGVVTSPEQSIGVPGIQQVVSVVRRITHVSLRWMGAVAIRIDLYRLPPCNLLRDAVLPTTTSTFVIFLRLRLMHSEVRQSPVKPTLSNS
jgi:hypothetical protein